MASSVAGAVLHAAAESARGMGTPRGKAARALSKSAKVAAEELQRQAAVGEIAGAPSGATALGKTRRESTPPAFGFGALHTVAAPHAGAKGAKTPAAPPPLCWEPPPIPPPNFDLADAVDVLRLLFLRCLPTLALDDGRLELRPGRLFTSPRRLALAQISDWEAPLPWEEPPPPPPTVLAELAPVLSVGDDPQPFAVPPFLEEDEQHLSITDVVGPKPPTRSWQDEWVAMNMEQAVHDGEAQFAEEARFGPEGAESIAAKTAEHADDISWKVDDGWAEDDATAHTLLSIAGVSALARALREHDAAYAASCHAMNEALTARARKMRVDSGDTTAAVAPYAFANLHGRFGLSSQEPAWGQNLTPGAVVGTSFHTHDVACATASRACFGDASGFAVPVMRDGSIFFEPQDSPVVCFVSRTTKSAKLGGIFTKSSKDGRRRQIWATGHSLIHTSAKSYDLPALATVCLETVVPPGEWLAYGRPIAQTLYVVGVSYPVELEENKRAARPPRKAAANLPQIIG